MGWGGDVAKDVAKVIISTGALGAIGLVWQHFYGSTPESAYQKAFNPIQLLQWQVWLWAAITVFLVAFGVSALLRRRPSDNGSADDSASTLEPKIAIVTGEAAPYGITDVQAGQVNSSVKIGIKNAGGKTLSNCKVYIEKISPQLNSPGGPSLLLDGTGFQLRHNDPEKFIEVAAHWGNNDKFRFSIPAGVGFFDSSLWMDDDTRRTFAIRVNATECERSALFEIWADESRRLHLKFLNYIN
ncbi:hypothetical protein [Paraburkholderia hospita]|uniref:Uncharacterized protein n=1 Tax=Paraburkholderia hospita TaxID=169430 RepID=A0AAN1JHY2_9BURK|nr:hypothetical protein [Paraburkholderia hospita]AUT74055.1 hypothetical protein C2L64_37800 [Paraburkholderia hospita]EIN02965.1 hypothetical protein WQE_01045 [Paraburkholderia hospita]OUL78675.1 hypothetical protein CA602_31015 [Paraburkholderia hospita]OUL85880.1 hypothetical protein CA601_23010 [Paraburkholderia hospita]SEH45292.1 hypothetical protein SAMN05192544_100228 [Paraburkholderia hospita]